jgi:hypothetical protein
MESTLSLPGIVMYRTATVGRRLRMPCQQAKVVKEALIYSVRGEPVEP